MFGLLRLFLGDCIPKDNGPGVPWLEDGWTAGVSGLVTGISGTAEGVSGLLIGVSGLLEYGPVTSVTTIGYSRTGIQ